MFGRRPFLDPVLQDWHVDCWSWLMRNAGGVERVRTRPLVLPNRDLLPNSQTRDHAYARQLFDTAKRLAGMDDVPLTLAAKAERPDRVSPVHALQHSSRFANTLTDNDGVMQISYDPRLLKEPEALVAVLARELGRCLTSGFAYGMAPPDMHESAIDVSSIFLGFGVCRANAAFGFRQFTDFDSQGWSARWLGRLSEPEWAFGVAMFCALAEQDIETAKQHMKPTLWREVRRAKTVVERDALAEKAISGIA